MGCHFTVIRSVGPGTLQAPHSTSTQRIKIPGRSLWCSANLAQDLQLQRTELGRAGLTARHTFMSRVPGDSK